MKRFKFVVSEEEVGARLDAFATKSLSPAISRNRVKKLIENGHIKLNSKSTKPSAKIHLRDIVCVEIEERKESPLVAYPLALNIIYEDEDILVLDKPAGLSVHPGAGNRDQTLANALIAYTRKLSWIDPLRPGIVHRLDKDTSGLLVVARNNQAHLDLSRQFKEHKVKKIYLSLVEGQVQFDEGRIDAPIAPNPRRRELMKVNFASKRKARTIYKVVRRFENFTLVDLFPISGRTHQLRVHMKYLGHPILGDKKYSSRFPFSRLALHAKFISFRHPGRGEVVEFNSPVPEEIREFINQLED